MANIRAQMKAQEKEEKQEQHFKETMKKEGGKAFPIKKLQSVRSSSTLSAMHQSLPGTPKSLKGFRPVSKPTSEIKTFGKTITYRDMPWHTINLEEKYLDPYSQVNLIRT